MTDPADNSSLRPLAGVTGTGSGTAAAPGPGLRLWPGVLIVLAMVVATQVIPRLYPRTVLQFLSLVSGGPVGALLLTGWWLSFSRVRGRDRWWFPVVYLVAGAVMWIGLYWGPPAPFLMVLGLTTAGVAWVGALCAVAARLNGWRRGFVTLAILLAWSLFGLIRVDGTDGDMNPEIAWRFRLTPEERLLQESSGSRRTTVQSEPRSESLEVTPGDWPGFRGGARDGRNLTDQFDPDWESHPPRELWRRRVGPGWGSCAVVGNRLFTQEQRGDDEDLACYDAGTGAEVWRHSARTRFVEGISGPGPRATPTLHQGRVYAYGATGRLTSCDAVTGRVFWSIDAQESGARVPMWGLSSSPLILEDNVLVYLGGSNHRGLAAFSLETGALVWASGEAAHSYASAHRVTLLGMEQVLLQSDYGIEAFRPQDGARLWDFRWVDPGINRDVQPIVDGDNVWISTGIGNQMGWKRLGLSRDADRIAVQELWFSRTLRPYYNDCVIHEGYAYGFDQNIFTCVRLSDGQRAWRQGRYGSGQVLLLVRQGLLIVQAESGDVVLLAADPSRLRELGRLPALSAKTWNHPVVARGRLYVRNGEELVCYELHPWESHESQGPE